MATYRADSAQETITATRQTLAAHYADPVTGRCVVCGEYGPCEPANDAFQQLARYGLTTPGDFGDLCATGDHAVDVPSRLRRAPLLTVGAVRRTAAAWRRQDTR